MMGAVQEMKETASGRDPGGRPPPHHQSPKVPRRRAGGSPDGDPGDDGSPNNGRYPSR